MYALKVLKIPQQSLQFSKLSDTPCRLKARITRPFKNKRARQSQNFYKRLYCVSAAGEYQSDDIPNVWKTVLKPSTPVSVWAELLPRPTSPSTREVVTTTEVVRDPPRVESSSNTTARVPAKTEEASRWGGLKLRILFGVVLGAICGGAAISGGWWFAIMVTLASCQCVLEYFGFVTSKDMPKGIKAPPLPLRNTTVVCAAGIILGAAARVRTGLFEFALCVLLFMLTFHRREKKRIRFSQITSLVFGLFYCGYLPSFWVRLRLLAVPIDLTLHAGLSNLMSFFTGSQVAAQITVEAGLLCTVLPICCIIAADTCAYLGGKSYGKTPLTQISPNKTVEGLAFGILGSMAVAFLCHCLIAWPASPLIACGLGFMIFLSSVFGDLIESSMKREAGMKDASDFIPGHGGVLDRFDSYLFTGVLVYFFWYWYFFLNGVPISQLLHMPTMPIIPIIN